MKTNFDGIKNKIDPVEIYTEENWFDRASMYIAITALFLALFGGFIVEVLTR